MMKSYCQIFAHIHAHAIIFAWQQGFAKSYHDTAFFGNICCVSNILSIHPEVDTSLELRPDEALHFQSIIAIQGKLLS